MRIIKDNTFFAISLFLWFLYTAYTVTISCTEYNNLHQIKWKQAENQSRYSSSFRYGSMTYNFVKDSVRISRKYPGLCYGINTWYWGINKKEREVDISFYIHDQDFDKVKNKQVIHRKSFTGSQLNQLESVPFFGLRPYNEVPNKFLLMLDVWKYNYTFLAFLIFLPIGFLLQKLVQKSNRIKIVETTANTKFDTILGYCFAILAIINIINFII
ncbi:hypothetical protein [Soonwooa sp.]|uniref:hypothetical protein n=1 Tax=Soonwooa sp. TaxID=1938592 RepID=UPI0026255589|nr:hypothetical protein [Soonwooa sp.]